jgi:hypothetical protein
VKIRRRDGKVLDIAEMRNSCARDGWNSAVAICDALEAALSVPPEIAPMGYGVSALGLGRNAALREVREAAGVIEESSS